MKARSKSEIEGMAKTTKSASPWREYPKDNGYIFTPYYRCNVTWWCTPCRKSFKRNMSFSSQAEEDARLKDLAERGLPAVTSACPLCKGPLESSYKRPVPWSKRGKRRARLAKYKRP